MSGTVPGGLARRLLGAMALVLATAGVTTWVVAGVVGPAVFHEHLVRYAAASPETVLHAEEAFRTSSGLALGVGLGAGTVMSLVVGLLLGRRVGRSLRALTSATGLVAGGRYQARVDRPGLGPEFDRLVDGFNEMAARLDASEDLRRRLMSDVAHELRTPVATLTAHLEALEDGVTELTPQTTALLRAQGTRLTRLAEDLAAVTRAESGEIDLSLETVDAAVLLDRAVAAAADRAQAKGVDLRTGGRDDRDDIADDDGLAVPLAVRVDAARMGQVLGNLVDNALRHTPPGGSVTLHVRRAVPDPTAPGAAAPAALPTPTTPTVELHVTDTGEGIEAHHLAHVFERFYRADDARDRDHGGSGIGLAITRALVEAHGGTIAAHSDGPGRGSTFTVTLPEER